MEKYTWVLLLMSLSTAIICCNCNNIECLPKERLILLRFNTEVGGLSVSWKGFNCCEWDGVECSDLTSHVTQLRLSNLVLQSSSATHTLAPLFELKQLEYLDISSNGFTGVIPAGVSALKELKHLDMGNNYFEGEIPLPLGNLSNLQYLNISMTEENGFKCWSSLEWALSLPNLQNLSVKYVAITSSGKELGNYISALHNLQFLDMSNCQISGPIPTAILNLTSLTHLDFHRNNFSSPLPPWLGNMTSLEWLSFYRCNLSGPFPLTLSTLPHLKYLRMARNEFLSGEISEILGSGWPQLALFTLSGSNIRGQIPSSIGNLSSLTHFTVVKTEINGPIPASVGNLPLMEELILRNNSLTGTIPPSLRRLSKLTTLDLSYNQLSGNIPSWLDGHSALDLSQNNLTGSIPPELEKLASGMAQVESSTVQSKNGTPAYYKEEISVTNKESKLVYVDSILLLVTCIDLSGNQLSGSVAKFQRKVNSPHLVSPTSMATRAFVVFRLISNAQDHKASFQSEQMRMT
ncbi:hypothetical protein SUGI_0853320 [Cryptomeria japonica]|nr:hypothetical protein SUGI_0853320 [Cryptomeria japonica]